jgi:hypothetical protein
MAMSWFLYFAFGPFLSVFSNINIQLDLDHILDLIIALIVSTIISKIAFLFKVRNLITIRETALLTPL